MTVSRDTATYLAKYVAKGIQTADAEPGSGLFDRDGLITTVELAAFLSLPVKTLRQWRHLGVGPEALRVGKHLRYEPAAVRVWLNSCRSERTA